MYYLHYRPSPPSITLGTLSVYKVETNHHHHQGNLIWMLQPRQAEQEVAAAEEIKDSSVLCSGGGGGGGGRQHRCEVTSLYQRTRQQTRTRPSECGNQDEKYYNALLYMMRPSWKYIILFFAPISIQIFKQFRPDCSSDFRAFFLL